MGGLMKMHSTICIHVICYAVDETYIWNYLHLHCK